MATLFRISRQSTAVLSRISSSQRPTCPVRCVFTSKRERELTKVSTETTIDKAKELDVLEKHFADADPNKLKNWVSEGWHYTDRDLDRFYSALHGFFIISITFVGIHFIFYYMPDNRMRDWAMREAYLDMDRRRKAGLPLVDPYLVPPEQVVLPTEEELGDQDIII